MNILAWLISIPLAVVIIAFAVANGGAMSVSLDPLPYAVDAPVWALTIGSIFAGFIIGGLIRWLLDYKWRRMARQGRRHVRALEEELSRLQKRLDQASAEQKLPQPKQAPISGLTRSNDGA